MKTPDNNRPDFRDPLQVLTEFLQTVSQGFYGPTDIVPNDFIESELNRLDDGIKKLNQIIGQKGTSFRTFSTSLSESPKIYEVIRVLLALPRKIGFESGLELGENTPESKVEQRQLYDLLRDMGFWKLLIESKNVKPLVRISLVQSYSKRRSFVVRYQVQHIAEKIVRKSIADLNAKSGTNYSLFSQSEIEDRLLNSPSRPDFSRVRGFDFVIGDKSRILAVIELIYITSFGGSQGYDIREYYPYLQGALNAFPVPLLIIGDGPGFHRASHELLLGLASSVYSLMSIKQARKGQLLSDLETIKFDQVIRKLPLDRIIENSLNTTGLVKSSDLPVNSDQARLALATYANQNPSLALALSDGGQILKWRREEEFRSFLEISTEFSANSALFLFEKLIGAKGFEAVDGSKRAEISHMVNVQGHNILPNSFLVVSREENISIETIKEIARESLALTSESKLAVVLAVNGFDGDQTPILRTTQRIIPVNIVVLDLEDLSKMVRFGSDPKDTFLSLVLEQTDLTKISPFVLNSATPSRIYYGRDREEATLLSALATNSVALLGSRRIGKTSFMNNVRKSLVEANFAAYYGDCQTVKNWSDFAIMAKRNWGVELPENFQPNNLFDLVKALADKSNDRGIIIMLDEIDQLVAWDMTHDSEKVTEAFFKACRTLSQNGDAQFVFSGERTIAKKLWDPESPHWNFCRSLPLRQLDAKSTIDLVIQPIEELQIRIDDKDNFAANLWKFTSGHPQIAQYIGDKLVGLVNEREPEERSLITNSDLVGVTDTLTFQEHYITTYWGQATALEKLISLLILEGYTKPGAIVEKIQTFRKSDSEANVLTALRILVLYGIFEPQKDEYVIRAEWFSRALSAFGEDVSQMIIRYQNEL